MIAYYGKLLDRISDPLDRRWLERGRLEGMENAHGETGVRGSNSWATISL